MTEAIGADARLASQSDVAWNSTILYDASPSLERAFESILNDDGLAQVATNGLVLASRAMRFPNFNRLQEFKGNITNRKLRNADSDLQRVEIRPRIGWETVQTKSGELNRIFFQPVEASAVALRGLYGEYVRQFPPDGPYNPQDPRQRLQSGSLSYTIWSNQLTVGGQDAVDELGAKLRKAAGDHRVVYASNPKPYDRPIG